jgi:RNA polymerase sigma-70 factor (ECF subfamily)
MGASNNSNESFSVMLAASQRRLLGYIMSLVPSLPDAEDILQDTNARLVIKQAESEGVENFDAWACRFAHYEVLNYRKRSTRDRHVFYADESLLDVLATEAQQNLQLSDEMISVLELCEEKLVLADRKMLSQRYRDGTTIQQLSSQSGRSEAAVRQSLYKTRQEMLKCIKRQLDKSQ